MGMYDRYKKDPDGLRRLVELLETTPLTRRQDLIDRGMKEDPGYTKTALSYVLTFQDIVQLPEMELTEVICAMKPKSVAAAISSVSDAAQKTRMLKCVPRHLVVEINNHLDSQLSAAELGNAKKEAIEKTRQLEGKGVLTLKKIPRNVGNSPEGAPAKKKGETTKTIELFSGKDLFSDSLFSEKSDLLPGGKKKAS